MSKTKKTGSAPEPMDPSVPEAKVGTPASNTRRVCWAVQTLVSEVDDLFPKTPVEYSNYDGRNTALDVSFDLTAMDKGEAADLTTLLLTVVDDTRVSKVTTNDSAVLVSMHSNPRTQDSRDSFDLGDEWMALVEMSEVGSW